MTKPLTESQRKFADDNHKLIYGFMHTHKLPEDDYYDICAIGYLKAVKTYDENKGKFSTLAYRCMLNQIQRTELYEHRHMPENTISYDKALQDIQSEARTGNPWIPWDKGINVEEQIERRALLEFIFQEAAKQDKDLFIFTMITRGYSDTEIASMLNMTPAGVSNRINKLSKKVRLKWGDGPEFDGDRKRNKKRRYK